MLLRIVMPDEDWSAFPAGSRKMTQEDADRLNAEGTPTLFVPDYDARWENPDGTPRADRLDWHDTTAGPFGRGS
jgi:hypothetical protein